MTITKKSIKSMTFEEALSELESMVKKIDSGQESLEASIELFERGVELKMYCEQHIKNAKLRIEKIVQKSSNLDDIKTEAVEIE